ncbi:MAG: LysM peptidoglycan-binding domain-containing M23 family metallopeptidase [Pseudomonadota bacterium]
MTGHEKTLLRAGVALLLAGALAACGGGKRSEKAPIEYRGSDTPTAQPTAPDEAAVLATGVRDYGDYQAAVATSGETVSELATRVGLSASELGAYNGLAPSHVLTAGDELVLPPRPGGYASAAGAPNPGLPGTEPVATGPTIEASPIDGSGTIPDGTITDGTAAAGADAWSPDYAEAAIARATGIDAEGNLAAPLSANDPLPENPGTPGALNSPNLQQYQSTKPLPPEPAQPPQPLPDASGTLAAATAGTATAAAAGEPEPAAVDAGATTALERPVAGPIAVGYGKGGAGGRNDGVDFAAAPGTPVVAADDGEVALVSQSLGGLGTIVLVRHAGDLLTVYGRVDNVDLKKGALVSRGQQIGTVAQPPSGSEGRMHFEVRRGAESLDPTRFIDG